MIDKKNLKRLMINTNGKTRVLYTYSSNHQDLKKKHESYASFLDDNFIPSIFSHAYTKNRSIYTNAKIHMLNDVFIKIDVKNFFPSINHNYLAQQMHFELNKKKTNSISLTECYDLIESVSIETVGLPLGLINSPMLSNIYMKRFDSLFYNQLKQLELQNIMYSRYADDIFISFKNPSPDIKDTSKQIIEICKEELNRCHLKINDKKTRVINFNISNHIKLAGINIVKDNDNWRKLTVSRKIVKDLYFSAIKIYEKVKQESRNEETDELEINRIRGMQSFILSVQKKGYSHVLSGRMRDRVVSLGYDSLEELIDNLNDINKSK